MTGSIQCGMKLCGKAYVRNYRLEPCVKSKRVHTCELCY